MRAPSFAVAAALVWAVLLANGCAKTSITSQVDETALSVHHTVMVFGSFADLDVRKLAEQEVADKLAQHGVACVPSLELFFPGNAYTGDEVAAKIAERHVDAILVLAPVASGTTETYVPPTYYTQGSAWASGGVAHGTATTTTTGGRTYHKPWEHFSADLYDVTTQRSVWIATAKSGGNAYAHAHTLVRSFCGQVVNKLVEDGVVAR